MKLIEENAIREKARAAFGCIPLINEGHRVELTLDEFLEDVPTADAELVKHGHWEYEPGEAEDFYCCSECDYFIRWPIDDKTFDYGYCPGCGAKMDGEIEL